MFPVDASFRLVRPTTLPIPASWFSPARPYEQVSVQFHIDGPGVLSPYCLPGEPVSDSPGPSCNRYSGLIRFVAYNPDAPVEGPRATMEAPIGWWTW